MCGIAGFCNMPENWEKNIKTMNERMKDRGPDANGIWRNEMGTVVLGHTRLAILDLTETGSQPMVSASGRYVIVLNGEIYNFNEIRKSLKNVHFRGTSDTEVLLEAVEKYGIYETLKKCTGMFAFALYDKNEHKIYLARDRVGEKPLYYGYISGQFVFASDIRAICAHDFFHNDINIEVLHFYLTHKYIPAPYTIYKDIYKLYPGKVLSMDLNSNAIKIHDYWDACKAFIEVKKHPFKGSYSEAKEELKKLLRDSVRKQMVADVPVGAFLSGGIDSSLTVSVMQELCSEKIKTFTIGFPDKEDDEAEAAKRIAGYLGTEHREFLITEESLLKVIPKLPKIYGEPFADTSQLSTYLVCELAREDVTVALSGDAGDELFCGYDSYELFQNRWRKLQYIPYFIRHGIGKLHTDSFGRAIDEKLWKSSIFLKSDSLSDLYEKSYERINIVNYFVKERVHLKTRSFDFSIKHALGDLNDLMMMDILMYLPDDILTKVDRSAMAVSLESRIPLLDWHIIEFAFGLPLEFKIHEGVRKRLMRDVLYDYVPKELMERPKKGFHVPVEKWIKCGKLREWSEELLQYGRNNCKEILDYGAINIAWNHFTERGKWIENLWYLLVFLQWHQYNSKRIV